MTKTSSRDEPQLQGERQFDCEGDELKGWR